jgi:hypothetical protein
MPVPAFTIRNNGGDYNTQSNNAYKFSDLVIEGELTAATPQTITIPTVSTAVYAAGGSPTRLLAFFSFTKAANVFLKPDVATTIALPTTTFAVGNTELNPDLSGGREVYAGQQIQLLTADTGVFVTIRLYAISSNM